MDHTYTEGYGPITTRRPVLLEALRRVCLHAVGWQHHHGLLRKTVPGIVLPHTNLPLRHSLKGIAIILMILGLIYFVSTLLAIGQRL